MSWTSGLIRGGPDTLVGEAPTPGQVARSTSRDGRLKTRPLQADRGLIPIRGDPDSLGDSHDPISTIRSSDTAIRTAEGGMGTALKITRLEHTSGALRALASKCRGG